MVLIFRSWYTKNGAGRFTRNHFSKYKNLFEFINHIFISYLQTQTTDMAGDTRESIKLMTQSYMNNPNAIILCIQVLHTF